jgi:hypothetical protein
MWCQKIRIHDCEATNSYFHSNVDAYGLYDDSIRDLFINGMWTTPAT